MEPLLRGPTQTVVGGMTPTHMEYWGPEQYQIDIREGYHGTDANMPFYVAGQISGDWLDDLDTAVSRAEKTIYTERPEHPDYLYIASVTGNENCYPNLAKMPEALGFVEPYQAQVQMQRPGCSMPKHVDPVNIFLGGRVRMLVMLAHWEQGQSIFFNNALFTHWTPGTVVTTDFCHTPHWTSNCSWHTRPLLQITGAPGEQLKMHMQQKKFKHISL